MPDTGWLRCVDTVLAKRRRGRDRFSGLQADVAGDGGGRSVGRDGAGQPELPARRLPRGPGAASPAATTRSTSSTSPSAWSPGSRWRAATASTTPTQEFHRQRLTGAFRLEPGAALRRPVPLRRAVGDADHRGVRPAPARDDDGPDHRAARWPARSTRATSTRSRCTRCRRRSGSSTRCCGWASGSAAPTSSAAASTACSRTCRSTRRSSSTRRRSTRAASTSSS